MRLLPPLLLLVNVAIPHPARNMLAPITVHAKIQTVRSRLQYIRDNARVDIVVYKGRGSE